MTVDALDADPELKGHTAVKARGEVHAVVSDYSTDERRNKTECGIVIKQGNGAPRTEYIGGSIPMCSGCWPDNGGKRSLPAL